MIRLVVLAAVLVTVVGCTSRSAEPAPSATSTPTTTTTTSPSPSPAPSPPPPTAPADGGNLAACADGTCEVRVTGQARIPLSPALGVSGVMITSLTGDEVSATATMVGSSFLVECTGDERCETSVVGTTPPAVFLTGHPGALITLNQTVVEVAGVADGAAILRFRPL